MHKAAHEPRSTEDSSFVCNKCNKTFKRKYSLKRHFATQHLGERPFLCTCQKRFATKEQLERHTLTKHSSEKPFKCERGCSKNFSSQNARSYHYKIHHDCIRFCCTFPSCGRAFTSLKNLHSHMKKPHAISANSFFNEIAKKESQFAELNRKITQLERQKQEISRQLEIYKNKLRNQNFEAPEDWLKSRFDSPA